MQRQTVVGQRWTDLTVPELGSWTPQDRVAVVLPARDNQADLDRTLAALAHQTYPAQLLEVVVVDDASEVPLQVPDLAPAGTRVVRREEQTSHGSGAARHAGAEASTAPVLLFLDSDMLADPRHVEAHARWHHVTDLAVVLGRKWFVDVDGITPQDIDAAGEVGVSGLLEGRDQRRHLWQEQQVEASHGLTLDLDDTFLTVVGATVSIRRDLYERCGGFAAFGLRGIVDTEFGYRAFTRGAVIIPDADARSWHQGARSFVARGADIKRARTGLAANHLPYHLFRPQNTGRRWAVPSLRVLVEAAANGRLTDAAADTLLLTVDSVLASDLGDLAVTVVTGGAQLPQWWLDYFGHDPRVEVVEEPPGSGFPSPLTAVVPPGVLLARESLSRLQDLLSPQVRVLRTLPDEYATPTVELWRTRTLERHLGDARATGRPAAELRSPEPDPGATDERWCPPEALGVVRVRPRTTPQGMVTSW